MRVRVGGRDKEALFVGGDKIALGRQTGIGGTSNRCRVSMAKRSGKHFRSDGAGFMFAV